MPQVIKNDIITPADKLRQLLAEGEVLVANLRSAGADAKSLLTILDEIDQEYRGLSKRGIDLRPEESRIATLHANVHKKKAILLRELRESGGLAHLRDERKPASDAWWWFLDEGLVAERKRAGVRYGKIALALIIILAIGVVIYQKFLKPNPVDVATYNNLNTALEYIMNGQYAEAIPYIEKNLDPAPQDAEWPTRLGVLEEVAGDPSRSAELFDLGRTLSANETEFLAQRAQYYQDVREYEKALKDAQRAAELDPASPMAFFLLGRSYSALGQPKKAIAAYEKVIKLTQDVKGYDTIYVLTKMDLAQLYQSLQVKPMVTLTP